MTDCADLFGALAGYLETVLSPNDALSSHGFARRGELGEHVRQRFRASNIPPQPRELPPANF